MEPNGLIEQLLQNQDVLIGIIRNLEKEIKDLKEQNNKMNLLVTASSPLVSMEEQQEAAMQYLQIKENEKIRVNLEADFLTR